jgi:hypothetical protein
MDGRTDGQTWLASSNQALAIKPTERCSWLAFLEEMSKSIADQREVDPGHQVGLELGQVDVEGAVKTEQGWRK